MTMSRNLAGTWVGCAAFAAAVLGPQVAEAQVSGVAPAAWESAVLLKAGTLGVGPELDVRVPETSFGLRADVDGLGFGDDALTSCRFADEQELYGFDARVRLGGTVRLLNGGLTADYYPFARGFRLSAGVIGNGNQVSASGTPVGRFRLGDATYSGVLPGRVTAGASFNAVAPMIGAGYTTGLTRRLRFSADVGAMYQGDPHLSYGLSGFPPLPAIAVAAQHERDHLQAQLDIPVYPIAMVGVGWRF